MTDNEIIKALKQHIERTKNIKYGARKKTLVDAELLKDIHDLINRQQAEIERLSTLAKLGNMRANDYRLMRDRALEAEREAKALRELLGKECDICIANREAEAIKEFAERLKENCKVIGAPLITNRIDNLVKEMVGDTE